MEAGRGAQIQLLIDGSNSTTALQALNTGSAVVLTTSVQRLLAETGRPLIPIEIRPQMLFNPTMRSPNFYVPGVIGVVLQIATTFATAMSVVRERERGTLEQLLVSPVSPWGLMLGKLIPYLCVGATMAVFLLSIMRFLFHVPIAGSVLGLGISTLVYLFALLSVGLLISTRAENQMQALQLTMALILPSVFFSGFIFPRENDAVDFSGPRLAAARDVFHLPRPRDHPARRRLAGLHARPAHPGRHVPHPHRRMRNALSTKGFVGRERPPGAPSVRAAMSTVARPVVVPCPRASPRQVHKHPPWAGSSQAQRDRRKLRRVPFPQRPASPRP